jgi:hypothetical protein
MEFPFKIALNNKNKNNQFKRKNPVKNLGERKTSVSGGATALVVELKLGNQNARLQRRRCERALFSS